MTMMMMMLMSLKKDHDDDDDDDDDDDYGMQVPHYSSQGQKHQLLPLHASLRPDRRNPESQIMGRAQ